MTRPFAHLPVACVLIFAGFGPLSAAELDVQSAVDAVTVYPDGATVTRLITVDLPQGDTTLIARDFPPGLDASSLRVEGETGARVTIGAIDARAPRPERPPPAPELEQRSQALKDERAALEDQIGAEAARKRFAERFAAQIPLGLGDKGEARPVAEWRLAFGGRLYRWQVRGVSFDDAFRNAMRGAATIISGYGRPRGSCEQASRRTREQGRACPL